MPNATINTQCLEDLRLYGHCVPRNNRGNVIAMKVGREYTVNNVVTVRVTQSNPTHIKIIY
jgi:hypothetical protein